ncbi:MAG: glycoside hydrolase family 13 protein [Alistipes sp.]|nr:glycoside hydrolase family 13 protein [Alistipes sp.]
MRRLFSVVMLLAVAMSATAAKPKFEIKHVEPLSWWVGMTTPLQIMVNGEGVSAYDVTILPEKQGVEVTKVHKADSPNYIFVDVAIAKDAKADVYRLCFSDGKRKYEYEYVIAERRADSKYRESFTNADLVYLIMPDRFANGNPENDSTDDTAEKAQRSHPGRRHGGDLEGMMAHLDYIADLGATAIWSTPLLLDNENGASYHGYSCSDYYLIDPRFGSNELFKEYVEKCHKRDLKVIMDIVPNHSSTTHWWYADQPFADWTHQWDKYTQSNWTFSTNMDFNASKSDLYQMESGWFDRSMADMNLDNPYLLHYFKQWAVWWVEYSDLDGFRVDTYPYNEKGPMSEWCKAVMAEYPNFNIVGEVWTSSIPQLAYWQGDNANKDGFNSHLKSIMDFPLHDAMRAAMTEAGSNVAWGQGMTRVYDVLSHDFVYHDLSNMMIMAANHDTDRIGDVCEGDSRKMKIVHTLLATLRGMPQILYGDELMFRSTDRSKGHPTLRVDFPGGWDGDAVNLFDKAQHSGAQKDVYDYTRAIMNWRKTKDVIHSGKTMHFIDRDNTYAYFRYDDNDVVFVFINNTDSVREIPWARYAEIAEGLTEGRDVITGEMVTMSGAKVAPMSALVVEFQR